MATASLVRTVAAAAASTLSLRRDAHLPGRLHTDTTFDIKWSSEQEMGAGDSSAPELLLSNLGDAVYSKASVSVTVTNTGEVAGDEVVQVRQTT